MTDESAAVNNVSLLFDRYRILKQVGVGRLTSVYHVHDERLRRDVLIHVLRKDLMGQEQLRQRLLEEINASAQCSHSALPGVFDSGEVGERPFMVTEYIHGRPLRDMGALTVDDALAYTRLVADAIAMCSARHFPHPPVSSSNILLVGDKQIKLVESWLMSPEEVAFDLSHYRAPERTEGQPSNPASLVYSLGVLLYELIIGTRPVSGNDAQEVSQAHLNAHMVSLSQARPMLYLPTLEKLLERATARFPMQRCPDVLTFRNELERVSNALQGETQPLLPTAAPLAQPSPNITSEAQGAHHQNLSAAASPAAPHSPSSVPPPVAPAAQTPRSTPPAAPHDDALRPLNTTSLRQKSRRHTITGWAVMIVLVILVAIGSYAAATFAADKLFAIQLPTLGLPDLGIEWPNWFAGGDPLVVTIDSEEGLNLRDAPGLASNVIATVPNGTTVYKLSEPEEKYEPDVVRAGVVQRDGVEWAHVRVHTEDGTSVQGWMSLLFLKKPGE